MQLDNKTEIALQEKLIQLVEGLQQTSRKLLLLLALVLILALPLGYFCRFAFFSLLFSPPNFIIYQAPKPQPVEVVERRLFSTGSNSYFSYVRITNPNADLAVRVLPYTLAMTGTDGSIQASIKGKTYLLPSQDRLLVFPAQSIASRPAEVTISFDDFFWSRVGPITPLNFIFEGKSWGVDAFNRFNVSAQLKNDNPYLISEAEVVILLYTQDHQIASVNSTIINLLQPDEIRYIRVFWPQPIGQRVVDVDFKVSVNQLDPAMLKTIPAPPDEFDPRSGE